MKLKLYTYFLIIAGGFVLNYCSPSIDIGDALIPIFHPTWPVTNCYTVVMNNYNTDPIENAEILVKYLNENDLEVSEIRYTDENGKACFDEFNLFYLEVKADGFQTLIFDHVDIPRTIVLDPIEE
ncbi:hypothetical protein [Gaetbulibacter aestuarii]|uniref:Carboxypeptidase regulatory-like domain-containing protein n=1 Tax=Gaetbulibacter aestuarii TaxID=1502358 RepID=A0ABW7MX18_9FLAO